ncbi:IS1634 family transposase [Blautia segnis]|uniref:Transposase n=1 Tax=Blautia segnis TaxID=2763030 RepID=A0A8I0DRD0_9FIRM|nr:transposase [Blautia segnis]MBC5650708.1 transposase [Blautia segnis]
MFLKYKVDIPVVPGKLVRKNRGGHTYIEYEYDRIYDPVKQYTYPKRASIGRVDPEDPTRMTPNENFLKYFPDAEIPEEIDRSDRSPYLNIGTYVVLHKLIQNCKLKEILDEYMDEKDIGFLLDLACYSIIEEKNAGQYYPDYAYEHALFTPDMKIYTDSKVSDFLHGLKPEQSVGFLNSWNKSKNKRQKIYLSYDSTNKNCQAGDIDLVEYGNAKVDAGLPIFNYSVACDSANRIPLFYELYPGSLNDVSPLICMIDKAQGYGYRNIGFILDRGYFSKKNLAYMDQNGYSFLIMVKGMKDFIRGIIEENQGGFENSRGKYVDRYDVYGTTVKRFLCEGDTKKRNFHIYYSDGKAYSEKQEIKQSIRRLKKYLDSCVGKECVLFGPEIGKYFHLNYEKDGKTLKLAEENTSAVEKELSLAGYFAIVSSDNMTAREAIELYKSRDASEKLFRSDKSYLGNKSMRVHSDEALSSKVFIQFIALILRSRIYTALKEKTEKMLKKPNYLTVPAALKELEKIVMIRQLDGVYRLDHAVTATQKIILDAFGLNEGNVRYQAKEIGNILQNQ